MATLRQLEYLVTVADVSSFTRAAETLHVTQPALSHQIRTLEQEVGALLLERLPRGVRPTSAGRAMLAHARSVIEEAETAVLAARRAAGLVGGELRVATVYSITLGILPAALATWSERHPAVNLRLFEHRHTQELADAVADGQADLAVGPQPQGWRGPIEPLGTEEFVVAVSADDPLAAAGPGEVALSALADRRWVHFAPDHGLADVLDRACEPAGFQPRVAVRTEQTASAPILAAAGLGPALVPANLVPDSYNGVLLAPVPPVRRLLTAYTRSQFDAPSRAFTDVLKETAAQKLRPAP
ncbi:LysR family transcriptional regulator [Streptomyces sp. ME01-18a]|uniref:LysR family transcriptional regulator n=1 Tax=Streptomyces sp. ME01-18a TaxID=3028669 RepID=UPI0029B9C34D|nr:LysR family transcriptional regulator [Streptomyces sp. ME01-18a]MDX3434167.1 LysR family transcriptional regulator [Streptomyces sp. ME01-18a]